MASKLLARDYVKLAKQNAKTEEEFENFKKNIFVHTLVWEGVPNPSKGGNMHNVAGDSGGWTSWGIAYNKNKEIFADFDDFKDTTYEEAAAIAYNRYYRAIQAFVLPKEAQLMYFDMAYNMGNMRAIKIMQVCAGVNPDGIIGPATRSRMSLVTEECLRSRRETFYYNLVSRNGTLKKFLKGWLRRNEAIFKI